MDLTYEQINSWDCYDNWDDPDPSNYIVMTCLFKALCERLTLFKSPSNFSSVFSNNILDYPCYNTVYTHIARGLYELYNYQTQRMKLFTDDSIIDKAYLSFEHGDTPGVSYGGDSGLSWPLFCKQKTQFSNTPYNSFKEQSAEFEILDFNKLYTENKIMESIPPSYSPVWAWKQFVKGAKNILQQCNYISSKWVNNSFIRNVESRFHSTL